MNHLKILGIKFGAVLFTVFALYSVFQETSLMDIILISLFTTIVSYLIGDLFILRYAGNINATISDFGLAFVLLLIFSYVFIGYDIPLITLALLGSFFISCCEPFLHGYIVNKIPPAVRRDHRTLNQLQTEIADEPDIYKLKKE
ncbi:DUF2512 family protein [Ornithinibacillus bavariensis]|uniref:Membrane protein YndM n=1 Tax=Ornithinibacillus bavariensis TaxID=545502 RepID=A0A919X741_9BACI|nr:DUF2512 family protein [Ornithinibacillus bavariensis]GIO27171.1 putative membrane protein YndM [Ornithinibacillus bavariensis]